ncbi:hypothetical protein ACQ1PF_07860 [Ornithobacterium rhinotracheale]
MKSMFKASPNFKQKEVNIDKKEGILYNVRIVEAGVNKNETYFSNDFLNQLVESANSYPKGIKSRFGHPNMCANSLGTYIGRYKNFRMLDNYVVADLHLDPITEKVQVEGKGISMKEYILSMAENNGDAFGNSIVIESDFEEAMFEDSESGKTFPIHKFKSLIASDLVDEPAATSGMFDNSSDLGVLVTNFLDEHPQVFDAIAQNPQIISDFFERYQNYYNKKNNKSMSFLNTIKQAFGVATFELSLTKADGGIIEVDTEAKEPSVGDSVRNEDGSTIADGDVLMADGQTLVVKDGVIAQIKAKEEKPAEEAKPSEFETKTIAMFEKMSQALENFEKFQKDSEQAFEMFAKKIKGLDARFETLAKGVKSDYQSVEEAEESAHKAGTGEDVSSYESLKQRQEKLKNKK